MADLLSEKNTVLRLISRADKLSRTEGLLSSLPSKIEDFVICHQLCYFVYSTAITVKYM
jgi:hypothetical protein